MMFKLSSSPRWLWAASLFAAPTVAANLPSEFTLGRYVPKDVWFYVHAVQNPERDWVDQRWAEVFKAVQEAGLDRDLAQMFLGVMQPEDRQEMEPKLERMLNVLRSVKWTELCGREFVMAERLSCTKMTNDYIVLVRAAEGTGERHFATLVAFFKELGSTSPSLHLCETTENDVQRVSLQFPQKEMADFGIAMELFRRGDVIGFASGAGSAAEVMGMMSGKPGASSLVDQPRFEEALSRVAAPRDSLVFVDVRQSLRSMREMIPAIAAQKVKCAEGGETSLKTGGGSDKERRIKAILDAAVQEVDVVDYVIETAATRGRAEYGDSAVVMQADKVKSPMAAAFLDRRPFAKFDQFIPADATGFKLSAGQDLAAIYRTIVVFLEKHVPEAAATVAGIRQHLAQKGFDLELDFFSWWSGESIRIDLPAAVVSPMGGSDSVMMFRVKDPALAGRKIDNALDFVTAKLQAHGQPLMVGPAAVKSEGFREVTHPALALFLRPVIGIHEDWLIVGSSAAAINKCLAVKAGEAPSFAANEKFKAEGLAPDGPVMSASFEDESKMGQELAAAAGMVGTFGQMALVQIPDANPEAKKVKELMRSGLGLATKLGPVLQKIDFYSSSSTVTAYDGDRMVRSRSKTTYKPAEKVTSSDKLK